MKKNDEKSKIWDSKKNEKVDIYNPKEFRAIRNRREEKFSKLSLFLFVVGFFLIIAAADYYTKGELYSLLNSDKKILIEEDFSKINDGEIVKSINPCAKGDYVSMEDVSFFKKHADILLREISDVEVNFKSVTLTKSQKIDEYNKVVLNSKGVISFYNEKLIKCYKNSALSNDVQIRAKEINKSLIVVKDLIDN